jgi:hypothetical protein
MNDKILELLRKASVSDRAVASFTDAYTFGPWKSEVDRDEWAKSLISLVESMLAVKPTAEVKQFLELQAARMDAAVAANPVAHQQALNALTKFLNGNTVT